MIVFGGCDSDGAVKYLSLKTYTWHTVSPISFKSYGHTTNLIGTQLYLFGGYINGRRSNDLVRFDTNAFKMESLQTSG